eukprot:SAG11_NODE_1774_length_4271_cov_4.419942_1_plen_536_part_00
MLAAINKGDLNELRGLTTHQKADLRTFFHESDTDKSGSLDYAEFAQAVKKLAEQHAVHSPFFTCRNLWLAFITSFFEVGTSLSLPAMGALAVQVQHRFDCDDAKIGELVAWYYLGSMFGPLFGGQVLMAIGPGKTIVMANFIVCVGAFFQALADGPDQFWMLCMARVIIGFGGLITPFCTLEVLANLFPEDFMFMAGFRNLIQSASGFLAFVILPAISLYYSEWDPTDTSTTGAVDPEYNKGTGVALWFCFGCGILSLLSNIIVLALHLKPKDPSEETDFLASQIRGFARTITPQSPSSCAQWKLPLSFYLSLYGIQAQYFAPFMFTSFSSKIYMLRFGFSTQMAGVLSGVMNIMGGLLGPVLGPVSDTFGQRAAMLAGFGIFTVVGFGMLATMTAQWVVYAATVLFALTYGFGDTVAYPNIRLLVGPERAGIGYGIFGFVGGLVAVAVPKLAGYTFVEPDEPVDTGVLVCWYFCGCAVIAVVLWTAVHLIEGPKAAISLPAENLVETEDLHLNAASLVVLDKTTSNPVADEAAQ